MAIIDSTIVKVAINTVGGNLGATVDEVAWVATGYIFANVVVMPLTAGLSRCSVARSFTQYRWRSSQWPRFLWHPPLDSHQPLRYILKRYRKTRA